MSKHLYNAKDVREVREELYNGVCELTGQKTDFKDTVLDHDHDTQAVRGVLHRQSNAMLGKIENNFKRYIGWWYNSSLSDFLRAAAAYLENSATTELGILHPSWIKKCKAEFNKLNEVSKSRVLKAMNLEDGKNSAERKAIFNKGLLTKNYTFDKIVQLCHTHKILR